MKYLVVGSKGQLGSELHLCFGDQADYVDIEQLDITKENDVRDYFFNKSYDFVINCAAYTAVDKAENEKDIAYQVNAKGAEYLAKYGKKIIYISTDYVFDGLNNKPYVETDIPNPISVYGKTKLEGENRTLEYSKTGIVIRTSWLYSRFGNNFLKTILNLARSKKELNIISDQIGTPTYARDLACFIKDIIPQIAEGSKGIYHFSNEGYCSWYDFASEIVNLAKVDCKINAIETKDYPSLAKRPSYSVLSKEKVKKDFNIKISDWKECIKNCLDQF